MKRKLATEQQSSDYLVKNVINMSVKRQQQVNHVPD